MKTLKHLSRVSWFLMLAGMTVTCPLSRAQDEKSAERETSRSNESCPRISVSCPDSTKDGEPMIFEARIDAGDPGPTASYNWTVFGGTLIQGQGTPIIKVQPGRGGHSYTASLEIGGLNPTCPKTASCSLIIERFPPIEKFDSFGILSLANEKVRLENFASALKNQPGAQGYVLSYGGRRGFAGEAKAIGERLKAYLVNDGDIHADRIVTVEGGFRQKIAVDLWVVPTGAVPPTPAPSVDPSDVRLIRLPPRKTRKQPPSR